MYVYVCLVCASARALVINLYELRVRADLRDRVRKVTRPDRERSKHHLCVFVVLYLIMRGKFVVPQGGAYEINRVHTARINACESSDNSLTNLRRYVVGVDGHNCARLCCWRYPCVSINIVVKTHFPITNCPHKLPSRILDTEFVRRRDNDTINAIVTATMPLYDF